jgi:hypothetical protein
MIEELEEKSTLDEAKKCFEELEKRVPNLNDITDTTIVSAIQAGIKRGYQMGYDKYYIPLCDECNFNRATCFGPGSYCDECAMYVDEE